MKLVFAESGKLHVSTVKFIIVQRMAVPVGNRISLIRKNCFRKMLEIGQFVKIVHLKVWHYTAGLLMTADFIQ